MALTRKLGRRKALRTHFTETLEEVRECLEDSESTRSDALMTQQLVVKLSKTVLNFITKVSL